MPSLLSSTTLIFGVLATSVLANPQYDYGGSSGSSSSMSSASATAAAAASTASNIHSVKVGPALTFTPDTVTAAEGDWVEFTFGAGHSVAESSFAAPCVPISGSAGVYSGFPNDGDVWRIQINSTDPLWLYCSATGHCEGGMAMVVNPPSSGNTLSAYKSAAQNAQGSSPETVQGGIFGAAVASGGSSSSASSSSTASATGSSASASASGNAAGANMVSNGLMVLGAVAAGVAAVL
ncbi:uncharacterized protein PV07_02719 [Cladophialophora immunda]|uniref:Phytocyanin domain-containing protein n=1 Tax=Cladophialophora immunda TaxID=569365 RepID=A0A0D2CLY7_9EURO|nr:uncharacterized protein PV07_02719 [Cladophialophora immunda]KIW31035.1 hypothetical protein PV07_02719 [Cladophialophora immunda]OQV05905.1 hypothetical protein CLAIMM_10561 [Cladophialophora immunda]